MAQELQELAKVTFLVSELEQGPLHTM